MATKCPFRTGELIRFTPSKRTRGLYQDIDALGVQIDEIIAVGNIKDDTYIYTKDGRGGWPWPEWSSTSNKKEAYQDAAPNSGTSSLRFDV